MAGASAISGYQPLWCRTSIEPRVGLGETDLHCGGFDGGKKKPRRSHKCETAGPEQRRGPNAPSRINQPISDERQRVSPSTEDEMKLEHSASSRYDDTNFITPVQPATEENIFVGAGGIAEPTGSRQLG
jgi:hypothetical protein